MLFMPVDQEPSLGNAAVVTLHRRAREQHVPVPVRVCMLREFGGLLEDATAEWKVTGVVLACLGHWKRVCASVMEPRDNRVWSKKQARGEENDQTLLVEKEGEECLVSLQRTQLYTSQSIALLSTDSGQYEDPSGTSLARSTCHRH